MVSLSSFFPRLMEINCGLHRVHYNNDADEVGDINHVRHNYLCEYAQNLADSIAEVEEMAGAQGQVDHLNSDGERQHAQSCRQRWRPLRKRGIADCIVDEPIAAPALNDSAENLRAYWPTVFAEKVVCVEAVHEFNQFVHKLSGQTAHVPMLEEIEAVISSTNSSSPGPADVLYTASKAAS